MKIDIKKKGNELYQEALIWMGYRYAIGLTEGSKAIQEYKQFRDIEYDTPEFHALAAEVSNYLRRKKIKDVVDLRNRLVENDLQWYSAHYALGRHSYASLHCHDIAQYGREVLDNNRKEFMAFDIRREISERLKWSLNFHQTIGSEDRLNPIEMLMNFLKEHSVTSANEIARYKWIEVSEEQDGTISFHTKLAEDETGSTSYLSFSSSIDDLLGWNDLASYFDPKCHKHCKVRFNNEEKIIKYFDSWHRCSYQEGVFPYQTVKIAIETYEKNPSRYCYICEEYVIEDDI